MEHLVRCKFRYNSTFIAVIIVRQSRLSCSSPLIVRLYPKQQITNSNKRYYCGLWSGRALDRSRPLLNQHWQHHHQRRRQYGMLVLRALRGVLKIRYLLIGGAVAGGGALQKVPLNWINTNKLRLLSFIDSDIKIGRMECRIWNGWMKYYRTTKNGISGVVVWFKWRTASKITLKLVYTSIYLKLINYLNKISQIPG